MIVYQTGRAEEIRGTRRQAASNLYDFSPDMFSLSLQSTDEGGEQNFPQSGLNTFDLKLKIMTGLFQVHRKVKQNEHLFSVYYRKIKYFSAIV